ncbi:unnamed protein product [Ectocarpus sp. 6 AP-2014]
MGPAAACTASASKYPSLTRKHVTGLRRRTSPRPGGHLTLAAAPFSPKQVRGSGVKTNLLFLLGKNAHETVSQHVEGSTHHPQSAQHVREKAARREASAGRDCVHSCTSTRCKSSKASWPLHACIYGTSAVRCWLRRGSGQTREGLAAGVPQTPEQQGCGQERGSAQARKA